MNVNYPRKLSEGKIKQGTKKMKSLIKEDIILFMERLKYIFNIIKNHIYEILFALGLGGIIEICFAIKLSLIVKQSSKVFFDEVMKGNYDYLFDLAFVLSIVATFSFMALLYAILGKIKNTHKAAITILAFVGLIILITGYYVVRNFGNIPVSYIIISWMIFGGFAFLFIKIAPEINKWLKDNSSKSAEEYSVAKLTLVWGIIVFLLSRL